MDPQREVEPPHFEKHSATRLLGQPRLEGLKDFPPEPQEGLLEAVGVGEDSAFG